MPQGAWTDIYQVGALIHQAATGRTPATSVARMVTDPMQPLTSEQVPGYSDAFLQGMQKALAVRPQDRPQSIAELRSLLGLSAENRAAPAPVEPSPSPIYIPITTPAAVQAAMASESASAQAPRFLPITETYVPRSEEHTSELQSPCNLVCRLLLEKKKDHRTHTISPAYSPVTTDGTAHTGRKQSAISARVLAPPQNAAITSMGRFYASARPGNYTK